MSQSQSRYILKLTDRDVVRAFESVFAKQSENGATLVFNDPFGPVDEAALVVLRKSAGYALTYATLTIGAVNWQWTRLKVEHNDPRSAEYDKLTQSWNSHAGTPDRIATGAVAAALDAALSRPLASVNPDAAATLTSHSEVLLAMEGVAAKVLSDATEHRQELERAYLQKDEALAARFSEERGRELERLKEEKERVDADLSTRSAALEERRVELDARQKLLDDRNNTHVRREIRSSLLALAKERLANFSVSRETRVQYWLVQLVALLGLVVLAYGAIAYGSQISPNEKTGVLPASAIALAIKAGALAATAIALGYWYLGWLNRWLQRIADAEFKLQQFRLDIERASWLAETVLEWKSKSDEPFPELLVTRLSAGLFAAGTADSDDPKTPAGHLAAALFGAASSAKLKLGDQELNLDRRSIKDLDK